YRANREPNFPLSFFVANPFAAQAIQVDNSGWSYFHGFEFEVSRRFASGFFFGANYTYGKVLTDTRFLTTQQENQNYLSLANRRLDKNRAAFDTTHSFASNYVYPLPLGHNKEVRQQHLAAGERHHRRLPNQRPHQVVDRRPVHDILRSSDNRLARGCDGS